MIWWLFLCVEFGWKNFKIKHVAGRQTGRQADRRKWLNQLNLSSWPDHYTFWWIPLISLCYLHALDQRQYTISCTYMKGIQLVCRLRMSVCDWLINLARYIFKNKISARKTNTVHWRSIKYYSSSMALQSIAENKKKVGTLSLAKFRKLFRPKENRLFWAWSSHVVPGHSCLITSFSTTARRGKWPFTGTYLTMQTTFKSKSALPTLQKVAANNLRLFPQYCI